MKKPIYTLLILIMLTLSACAGQAPLAHNGNTQPADQVVSFTKSASAAVQSDASTTRLNTDFDNAESIITQLTLGIIKLDGTDLAVTKDQATALLPLWDQYVTAVQKMMPSGGKPGEKPADASGSGTPAAMPTSDPKVTPVAPAENTELTALTTSMQAVLTDAQISAIAEMKITRDIATTIMKEKNITSGGPDQQSGTSSRGSQPQRRINSQPQKPADSQGNNGGRCSTRSKGRPIGWATRTASIRRQAIWIRHGPTGIAESFHRLTLKR